jgi:hypothetical protein
MQGIRLLKANEIDVRVGTINEKGATLLLYKDARVDMNILDESGVKWKRSHELINGNLFCTISIWDEDIKEWITRQDVGVESNTEKEKGQASDAFKRAAFNFGIGRELYTAPFTWISSDNYNGYINGKTPQGKDRYATYDKFSVVSIEYNDAKEIIGLVIKNDKNGKIVFTLGRDKQIETKNDTPATKWKPSPDKSASDNQKMFIANLLRQHQVNDNDMKEWLADKYGIIGDMSQSDAQMIIDDLNTKEK